MPTFIVTAISTAYDMVNMQYRKDNCGLKLPLRRVKWKISTSSLLMAENLPTTLSRNTLNNDLHRFNSRKHKRLNYWHETRSFLQKTALLLSWKVTWFSWVATTESTSDQHFQRCEGETAWKNSPLLLTSSLRYHASQPILTIHTLIFYWETRSACSAGKLLTPAQWPHGAQLAPSLSFETLWKQEWSMLVFS